jgi:hypothetical protein
MSVTMILLPVVVHALFVFVLLFWGLRGASADRASAGGWREELTLPVLLYVLTICAWQTRAADYLFVIMAWIFVALRILDAFGFATTDRRSDRSTLFIVGAAVLALMWIIYAVRLFIPVTV